MIRSKNYQSLLQDVRCTILSKLSLEDAVRTSTLSRNWKCSWSVCPKLKFNGVKMCGTNICGKQKYVQNFINHVNAVLGPWHSVMEEWFKSLQSKLILTPCWWSISITGLVSVLHCIWEMKQAGDFRSVHTII